MARAIACALRRRHGAPSPSPVPLAGAMAPWRAPSPVPFVGFNASPGTLACALESTDECTLETAGLAEIKPVV